MATPPTKTPAKAPARKRTGAKSPATASKAASAKAAAPKSATTPKAVTPKVSTRKPSAIVKPNKPVAQAKAAVAAVPTAARKGVAKAKAVVAAIPVPEVTPHQAKVAAVGVGGIAAALGAAFVLWRATKADQPDYRLVERDGDFEIREYPALVTAGTEARGPRDAALDRGFGILADYIFAKSRGGEKLKMTAPVLSDKPGDAWRTRFIMPAGKARADLPTAPAGVTLDTVSPRRVAAVRFAGRADDASLHAKEGALRSWLQLKGLPSDAKAEHGFYNSPMMPGPLRRNEVLVTLSQK